MDPYGPVWVRMVPGDLFQGLPGPKPLKIIEKCWFWVFWGWREAGTPCPGPCLVAYVCLRGILTYMPLRAAYGFRAREPLE